MHDTTCNYIGINNGKIRGNVNQQNAVPIQFASFPKTVRIHFVDRNGEPLTGVSYSDSGNCPVTANADGTFTVPYNWNILLLLGITHVLARVTGGLASFLLPGSTKQGMLSAFREAASKGNLYVLIGWAVLALTGAAFLMPLAAGVFLLASAAVFFYVKHIAKKQFGGMSGDLAGFCISVTEITLLFVLVLSERAVTLWF